MSSIKSLYSDIPLQCRITYFLFFGKNIIPYLLYACDKEAKTNTHLKKRQLKQIYFVLIKESLKAFCKHFPAKKQDIYFFLTALSLRKAPSVALVLHFTVKVSDFILFPSAGRREAPSPLSLNWPWLLHCATLQSWTTSRKVPHHSTHTAAGATQ